MLSLLGKYEKESGKSCFTVCAEARVVFILVLLARFNLLDFLKVLSNSSLAC